MRDDGLMTPLMQRFARDSRGVSAVEFALVLPLMLTLYIGSFEISQGISASRKVTLVSRTVADLSSQNTRISNASMTNFLGASAVIVAPLPTTTLKVTVSCLTIDSANTVRTTWSETLGGTTHGTGSIITTVPGALNIANTSLVWSEVTYTYTPLFGTGLIRTWTGIGTIDLQDQMYMRPRQTDNCPSRIA
jgi:Flp pilus assembly protein TadG